MAFGKKKSNSTGANRQLALEVVVLLAVILFGISGWLWWHFLRSNPENIFWGMMDNNLRTQSVTKQSSEGDKSQRTIQSSRAFTSPDQIVKGVTKITQQSDSGSIKVLTETVGTPHADFVRYLTIESTEKNASGKTPDFSNVKNVWGKAAAVNPKSTTGQLYSQAVLGVVPFGSLNLAQRQQLLQFMKDKKVYVTDFNSVDRFKNGGRSYYEYQVSVSPMAYIQMLQMYAKMAGLNQLNDINAEDYKDSSALKFKLQVDVFSKQLVGIKPLGGAPRTEAYGGYGIISRKVALPTQTITLDELQTRLQTVR
jgi:hypothetical protein